MGQIQCKKTKVNLKSIGEGLDSPMNPKQSFL